jgi:thiol-disulfide isomerase/thioredoxin
MKQIGLFIILLLSCCCSATAQDSIRISGMLKGNTRFAKIVVKKFGVGAFDIAAVSIQKEKFSIGAPLNIEPGVYRFQYSQVNQGEYVDVIVSGKEKEISFTLDVSDTKREPVFTQSEENKNWYDWKQSSSIKMQKIALLHQLMAQYPDTTASVYRAVSRAATQQIKDFKSDYARFVRQHTGSWAGSMVANVPYYFTRPRDLRQLQDYYRKQSFWKGIDTSNPKLINSPLYTDLILSYLRYYMNPEMEFSEAEMNEGFKNSVDTIMQKFGGNEQTRTFALKYMQLGFKEIANEKVLQYIDEKYRELVEQCTDDAGGVDKQEFEKRMAAYAAMKPGTKAPDIQLIDEANYPYGLAAIPQKKLIVAFWASWCPNCEREMPKLEAFIRKHPEYGVVAVSLDEDSTAYHKAVKQYPGMIHTCDYMKWKGKVVKDYYIVASPTFIVLDAERKIVGKYPSFDFMMEELLVDSKQ